MALALLQLIAFASTAAAITFTVQPGVAGRECLVQSLSPEHLLPGTTLPEPFQGRASFIVRAPDGLAARGDEEPLRVMITVTGPHDTVLWQHTAGADFTEDAVWSGQGMGTYTLCFSNTVSALPIAVDVNYFTPWEGSIDPHALDGVSREAPQAAAEAEDVAVALHTLQRMQGKLRRIQTEQAFLVKRQARHAETLSSSDRRSATWAGVEALALAALSGAQMLLFRTAFRNR